MVCVIVLGSGAAAFAQTIWTATLTVGSSSNPTEFGWTAEGTKFDDENLTDVDFSYDGRTWEVFSVRLSDDDLYLAFRVAPDESESAATHSVCGQRAFWIASCIGPIRA